LKILHVIDSGGLYGAEMMLLALMTEQVLMGLEPVLASIAEHDTQEKPLEAEAIRLGLCVIKFRMMPGPNPFGVAEILRFAQDERVDLIHSHGYKGNIFFGLLPRFARRFPLVSTVHGWTWTGGVNRMMLYEWLDSKALSGVDRIVLVNTQMLKHPRIKRIPINKVSVVDNGIVGELTVEDDSDFDAEVVSFCEKGFTIGAIGRLSQEKGFDILLRAFAGLTDEFPEIRVVILGEGGWRAQLEALTEKLGISDRVLMPGFKNNARRYIPFFNLFAISSHTEGLPISLLEAMQASIPIVASCVGGIPDVLQDGRCGLLVNPGSEEELGHAIAHVIQNPREAGVRVTAARQRAIIAYSSRRMAEEYLEIYKGVLQ
jgi:glycosyltransferase involved in cell wall biosynthesis